MPNEQFQARLPDDIATHLHEYREEVGAQKSEAIKHYLESGIRAEQARRPAHIAEQAAMAFAVGALILAPLSLPFPSLLVPAAGYAALALAAYGGALHARGALSRAALARLRGSEQ